ncbi:MAG: pyridoxal phosphate-dependent aminotransferase [Clostridiales bacterium]|nr:pyridoxal phosphate-dependent aminotransferase [Clostridiales bacterium]
MYDFSTVVSREKTGSIKTDIAPAPVKAAGIPPLTIADQEFAVAPEIRRAVKRAADRGIYGYTYADDDYKKAVLHWMKTRHNWDASGMKLITTAGVVPALSLAVAAFTEPGDAVVLQPPVYMMFAHSIEVNGRRIVENRLINNDGHYTMDYDDLDEKTKPDNVKLMLLCSPHNPVGRVWTREELTKLGEICKRNNVLVIADEIHNDLLMNGAEHTVFASIPGMAENCVTCTAVSKTFNLAGLGCSNIFFPSEELANRFKAYSDRFGSGLVPYFARAATISAYTECAGWVDELNEAVYSNFIMLRDFINDRLPMLRVVPLEGTYLAWVDMRSLGLDNKTLESRMLSHGLAFDEGHLFGENGAGFERWNLALPASLLAKALCCFEKAVQEIISK